MRDWIISYSGPSAELHLIGPCADPASQTLLNEIERESESKLNLSLRIWGELPHSEVLEVLRNVDIGLCLLDTGVLNYKYAYPVKVIEYMNLGLIVLATESHGTRALIMDGQNGFIERHKTGGFCQTMERAIAICQDPITSIKVRDAARKAAWGYEWNSVNYELLQRLESVFNQ
ncbi:glycosyltransferase [Nitrosococcus wardiae]|nr:glycosyltransferase [Nitrosococcus wardiae]